MGLEQASALCDGVTSMPLLPACRETHPEIIAGICPLCHRTISKGHVLWQFPPQAHHETIASSSKLPFPLAVKDAQGRLSTLISELNEPAEEARRSATWQLWVFGKALDLWEAEQLEPFVGPGREDLWLRIILLGCYLWHRDSQTAVTSSKAHALWIIENAPGLYIAGLLSNNFEEKGDSYERAKQLWSAALVANPRDLTILSNAALFFLRLDGVLCGQLLRDAKTIEPDKPEWSRRLACLYRLEMHKRQDESRQDWAAMTLAEWRHAETVCTEGADRVNLLPDLAMSAVEAGDLETARAYAQELLSKAPHPDFRGNPTHVGNIVLGRIALRQGNVEAAKEYLINSAMTPGAPVFKYFTPCFSLAKELLDVGERECVLRYFRLCSRFWGRKTGPLAQWIEEVERGDIPDFAIWQVLG
jgi:hypothetical protein